MKYFPPIVRNIFLVLALLGIVALITDLNRLSRNAELVARHPPSWKETAADTIVDLSTSGLRYEDAAKRFSIAQLTGSSTLSGSQAEPFDVVIRGLNGVEVAIMVDTSLYSNVTELETRLQAIEREQNINTHIEVIDLHGRPAVQRTCRIHLSVLRMIDCFTSERSYHLQFSAPPEAFEDMKPALEAWLNTFEPQ